MIFVLKTWSKKLKKNSSILKEFLNNAFNLKSHLMEYLSIKECDLDGSFKCKDEFSKFTSWRRSGMFQIFILRLLESTCGWFSCMAYYNKDYIGIL